MAMYGIVGTPGSGKSLFAIQKILVEFLKYCEQIKQYREIYHNLEGLNVPYLLELAGLSEKEPYWQEHFHNLEIDDDGNKDEITPRYFWLKRGTTTSVNYVDSTDNNKVKQKMEGEQIENGSLVILDEVQNIYSARNTLSAASDQSKNFLTKHRHFKITLYWLTQNQDAVDVSFRRNTDQIWKLERLENIAFTKAGKQKAAVKKYLGWDNMDSLAPFAIEKFSYDSKFFRAYDSYVKGTENLGEEVRKSTNMFLQNKGLRVVAVLLLLCVGLAIVMGNPLTNMTKKMDQKPTFELTHPKASGESGKFLKPEKEEYQKTECFTNYVVRNGLYIYMRDNEVLNFEPGVKYEKCKN